MLNGLGRPAPAAHRPGAPAIWWPGCGGCWPEWRSPWTGWRGGRGRCPLRPGGGLAGCEAAWQLARRGLAVQPFKKGPDYIDPMWLSRAAGRDCHNLDFQVMSDSEIRSTFARHAGEISIVEGNMGLFDSIDVEGEYSNAAMAALLQAPVVLVVNVLGMTRSAAPLVLGFLQFDPRIRIAGIILNNVAGKRHEERLRQVFERYVDVPLLGCIHRDPELAISERHLGLIPSNEAGEVERKLDYIAAAVGREI